MCRRLMASSILLLLEQLLAVRLLLLLLALALQLVRSGQGWTKIIGSNTQDWTKRCTLSSSTNLQASA
jgi:hypothetical protein